MSQIGRRPPCRKHAAKSRCSRSSPPQLSFPRFPNEKGNEFRSQNSILPATLARLLRKPVRIHTKPFPISCQAASFCSVIETSHGALEINERVHELYIVRLRLPRARWDRSVGRAARAGKGKEEGTGRSRTYGGSATVDPSSICVVCAKKSRRGYTTHRPRRVLDAEINLVNNSSAFAFTPGSVSSSTAN